MEGPLYPSSIPFRPIPVYGQTLQAVQHTALSPVRPQDVGDRLALTKHFDMLSRVNRLSPFGDYHIGQMSPLRGGTYGNNPLHDGLRKFHERNTALDHAMVPDNLSLSQNSQILDFSRKTPPELTAANMAVDQHTVDTSPSRLPADRLTVPVLVSCPNPFSSQYGYGRKVFPCPQCRYTTDRRNNLKRHMLTMHQTCSKVLECCGIFFPTKASLREHSMIFHYHGYTCFYCGRRFCRKALLKRHLSVHNGQKDFICSVCDYATSHKSNLERHRKVHCRPEDDKSDELDCGTEQMSPTSGSWRSESHDNNDVISSESDDENEEINVDSD